MKYISLFLRLIPFIVKLMHIAEDFGDPGSGADKKGMVVGAVGAVVDGVEEASTGGQKETWGKIKEPISGVVDIIAGLLF